MAMGALWEVGAWVRLIWEIQTIEYKMPILISFFTQELFNIDKFNCSGVFEGGQNCIQTASVPNP